jgi:hypothetical protein
MTRALLLLPQPQTVVQAQTEILTPCGILTVDASTVDCGPGIPPPPQGPCEVSQAAGFLCDLLTFDDFTLEALVGNGSITAEQRAWAVASRDVEPSAAGSGLPVPLLLAAGVAVAIVATTVYRDRGAGAPSARMTAA